MTEQNILEDTFQFSGQGFQNLMGAVNLFETLKDVVWTAAGDRSKRRYGNRAVQAVYGRPAREFIQNPRLWLEMIHPDDVESVKRRFLETPRIGKMEFEYRIVRPGGEIRWVLDHATAMAEPKGRPAVITGTTSDITGRKRAEEELRQKEDQVKDQARELDEVNIALKVLLDQREKEKKGQAQELLASFNKLVFPYLDKIKREPANDNQVFFLGVLESNLKEIVSAKANGLTRLEDILTPAEIEVADLLRRGLTNKRIAEFLNLSVPTVAFHRGNIRKKLGLKNKKVNLRTYLQAHK